MTGSRRGLFFVLGVFLRAISLSSWCIRLSLYHTVDFDAFDHGRNKLGH